MVHLWWGLLGAAVGTVMKGKAKEDAEISKRRALLALAVGAIQGVVLFVVLCPVAILYVFGLGISAGASLWRLIKHDFGNDGGANKKPALQVLYSLAVAQGVLFGYKIIHAFAAKGGLVKFVYNGLDKQVHEELIAEYLEETVAGCEKDPSFATGRNFVTYGVDLMMEAKSSEGFIAGIKVLGGAIDDRGDGDSRKVLLKHLLTRSDSSSYLIQRLLETVGPRSPYSREIKANVVRILDIIVRYIPLEQLPRAIECLCSVVDKYEDPNKKSRGYGNIFKDYDRVELLEEYEKVYLENRKTGENDIKENRMGFDQLLVIAANIIYKLVTDKDTGWNMPSCVSNTMLHKIPMFPTKLHRENHNPCYVRLFGDEESDLKMLEQCWVLTNEWLLVAPTDTSSPPLQGTQEEIIEEEQRLPVLRSKDGSDLGSSTIRRSIESTIKSIFDCLDCGATQKRQAIQILLHLSWDMSFIVKDNESSKTRLSWILLLILCSRDDSKCWMVPSLTYPNNNSCDFNGIRKLAGEKLSDILREKHGLPPEEAAESQLINLALEDLKSVFESVGQGSGSIIAHALMIMEGLCSYYSSYYIENYNSAVAMFLMDAIPKVVEMLIHCGSKTAERQEQDTDLEKGNVSLDSQDDGGIDTQGLRKGLVSLCQNGYMSNYILRREFKEIASETCEKHGKTFGDFKQLIYQSIK